VSKTELLTFAALAAALTLLAIPLVDRPLAEFVRASGVEGVSLFRQGTALLDLVTGKEVSKFLLGFVLIGGGLALMAAARLRPYGTSLLFVGLVQSLSTLLCGVGKNLFGRLRPHELLASGNWDQAWWAEGSSFPSGHVGFYLGLFLPLAALFPRWRWPLLAVPVFIALARVGVNDHFPSDVTASMAVVAMITLGIGTALGRLPTHSPPPGSNEAA
jgi:membrane-associated phospholipid phosphatase